jgi:predicted DNA-binding transcriptional regulator YafY
MYHPTSRVLTVLELLQAQPFITGPKLAARLEMDVRTVRRYITHLQDVGIPIEGTPGRHGGYRLRPSFKLPPLLFTEDEATAILLGLLGTSWLDIAQSTVAVEGALAKLFRVLPLQARARLNAMTEHVIFSSPQDERRPDIALLIALCEAIGQEQRVAVQYRSSGDEVTRRQVEPYGLVGWTGHWYLVGYCCLREACRVFRLDRIQQLEVLKEQFERPAAFDCRDFVAARYGRPAGDWTVEVEFAAPLYTVRQRIPAEFGQLSATAGGTLFQTHSEDLPGQARYLMSLGLPFVIRRPMDLRQALLDLAQMMAQTAAAG